MTDKIDSSAGRVHRHRLADRLFHWSMAACMLTLLVTGFLPIFGIKFAWVDPHWIAGLILTLLVIFHIIRVLFILGFAPIWIRWREFVDSVRATTKEALGGRRRKKLIGKYSVGQKVFHHGIAIVVLAAIVTGLIMMVGIDGPFWQRNPLFMSEAMRGIVFAIHGFAGLFSIMMIMVHIYFAIRPEKFYMTRSMIRGWISRKEYDEHHDPELWSSADS